MSHRGSIGKSEDCFEWKKEKIDTMDEIKRSLHELESIEGVTKAEKSIVVREARRAAQEGVRYSKWFRNVHTGDLERTEIYKMHTQ
jgi:hypothetical protein